MTDQPEPPASQPPGVPPPLAATSPPPPPVAAPPLGSQAWQAPTEQAGPAPGVEFAPHGARLFSYILDVIILSIALIIFSVVVAGIIAASGSNAASIALAAVLVVGVIVLSIGYFPWFWMHSGQTPGMRPFSLVVVRDRDGSPIDGGQAVLRLIGYWIDALAFYIGFAWILIDDRRRGWHDLIAGTVVIKR
jgi:uncharacterized RDD family membrane protein YckC